MKKFLTMVLGALLTLAAAAREAELPADPPDAVAPAAAVAQAEALKLADNYKASAPLPELANKPFATFVMENEICDGDGKEIFFVEKRGDWQLVVSFALPLGLKRGAALQVQGTIEKAEAHAASGPSVATVFVRLIDVKTAKPKRAGERRSASSFKTITDRDLEKLADLHRSLPAALRPALPLPVGYNYEKMEERVDAVSKSDGRYRLTIRKAMSNWGLVVETMTSDSDVHKGDVVRLPKGRIESLRFELAGSMSVKYGIVRLSLDCDNVKVVSERKQKKEKESTDEPFKRVGADNKNR